MNWVLNSVLSFLNWITSYIKYWEDETKPPVKVYTTNDNIKFEEWKLTEFYNNNRIFTLKNNTIYPISMKRHPTFKKEFNCYVITCEIYGTLVEEVCSK